MQSATYRQKYSAILYDADRFPRPTEQWFQHDYWPGAETAQEGRGATWFIHAPIWSIPRKNTNKGINPTTQGATEADKAKLDWAVLKHYRRGGWVAPLLQDRYWFWSWHQARSWREWSLLAQLWQLGLPVPQPYMAYAQKRGRFYRCALITARIPFARALSCLSPAELGQAELWHSVGRMLARLCAAGVHHVDFNLGNILYDTQGQVFCIDFDRARYYPGGKTHPLPQIKRLQRSYDRYYQKFTSSLQTKQGLPTTEQIGEYLKRYS